MQECGPNEFGNILHIWTTKLIKVSSDDTATTSYLCVIPSKDCFPYLLTSVTRSGDLLDFGQLLNAFGNT